jgi:hypothetical protein
MVLQLAPLIINAKFGKKTAHKNLLRRKQQDIFEAGIGEETVARF